MAASSTGRGRPPDAPAHWVVRHTIAGMGELNRFWRTIRQVAKSLFARLLGWDIAIEGLGGSAPDHASVVATHQTRFRAARTRQQRDPGDEGRTGEVAS